MSRVSPLQLFTVLLLFSFSIKGPIGTERLSSLLNLETADTLVKPTGGIRIKTMDTTV